MSFGPKPWTDLKHSQVSIHRNLDCPLYTGCLSQASRENWGSFTCAYCSMYKGTWTQVHDPLIFSRKDQDNGNLTKDVEEMERRSTGSA